jgi:hypothetical protein
MVMEKMNEALEELKRVDHLIYVSLKYTRTVDVILNILNRMVDAYSFMVDALILYAQEQNKLSLEPESALERASIVRRLYAADDFIVDNMGMYVLLRKLLRSKHVERENEYRRHVTMKTLIDGREEIVNIDIITNYYLFQRDFLGYVKQIVDGIISVEISEGGTEQFPEPGWMQVQSSTPEAVEEIEREPKISARTPPTKQQVKVRSINSSPRKRVPREKKYKIQVPTSENAILRPPYEHDPKYNQELKKKQEEEAKKQAAEKKAVKKKVVKKKASVRKKIVKKKGKKKAVKKKTVKKKSKRR